MLAQLDIGPRGAYTLVPEPHDETDLIKQFGFGRSRHMVVRSLSLFDTRVPDPTQSTIPGKWEVAQALDGGRAISYRLSVCQPAADSPTQRLRRAAGAQDVPPAYEAGSRRRDSCQAPDIISYQNG